MATARHSTRTAEITAPCSRPPIRKRHRYVNSAILLLLLLCIVEEARFTTFAFSRTTVTFSRPPSRPFFPQDKSRNTAYDHVISSANSLSVSPTLPSIYQKSTLDAAPEGALPDIVIPSIFDLPGWDLPQKDDDDDPRVWVPQTPCLSFRPLCFCTSQGYYVNLLKFTGGGVLGRHRHSSPVHALTLRGSWGYREHSWHAYPGTYVFEPPGETHTLVVDEDCEEMVALFHVTGSLLYVSEDSDEVTGFDDVFTKLEKARAWYEECGLGKDYVDQFIR